MRALRALSPLPLLTALACSPSPPTPGPLAPPPPVAAPLASALPSLPPAAPDPAPPADPAPPPAPTPPDDALCHFAQGVTPSDPKRVCDPCSLPPKKAGGARRPILLYVEVSGFMSGTQTLEVDPQRMATWTKRAPAPGAPSKTWRAKLSVEQLASVETALAGNHLCAQRSTRGGEPDEATVLLAACLPSVRCELMLWGNEWQERPDAKAAISPVDAVIDDVVKRGAPTTP